MVFNVHKMISLIILLRRFYSVDGRNQQNLVFNEGRSIRSNMVDNDEGAYWPKNGLFWGQLDGTNMNVYANM